MPTKAIHNVRARAGVRAALSVALAGAASAQLPAGFSTYFTAPCPAGWEEVTQAKGRVVVSVPDVLGNPVAPADSQPLLDRTAPTHTHATYGSFRIASRRISLAVNIADGYAATAARSDYEYYFGKSVPAGYGVDWPERSPSPSNANDTGLPFVQMHLCRLVSASASLTVPPGAVGYAPSGCNSYGSGWSNLATTAPQAMGRTLVPAPTYAPLGLQYSLDRPLAIGERRSHFHTQGNVRYYGEPVYYVGASDDWVSSVDGYKTATKDPMPITGNVFDGAWDGIPYVQYPTCARSAGPNTAVMPPNAVILTVNSCDMPGWRPLRDSLAGRMVVATPTNGLPAAAFGRNFTLDAGVGNAHTHLVSRLFQVRSGFANYDRDYEFRKLVISGILTQQNPGETRWAGINGNIYGTSGPMQAELNPTGTGAAGGFPFATLAACEQWPAKQRPVGRSMIVPVSAPGLTLRHCNYVAYTSPTSTTNMDFVFDFVPALHDPSNPNKISFRSVSHPGHYLVPVGQIDGATEARRLGIAVDDGSEQFRMSASFWVRDGASDASMYTFEWVPVTGAPMYIALNAGRTGNCGATCINGVEVRAGAGAEITWALAPQPALGRYQITSGARPGAKMRHCVFSMYATAIDGVLDDFGIDIVAAPNGEPGAVAFRASNYPDYMMAPAPSGEGLQMRQLSTVPASDVSFRVVPNSANPSLVSFISLSSAHAGKAVAIMPSASGPCTYNAPAGDLALTSGGLGIETAWLLSPMLPPLHTDVRLINGADPSKQLRHCNFIVSASAVDAVAQDFIYTLRPALYDAPGIVSFESKNFPGRFLTTDAFGRLRLGDSQSALSAFRVLSDASNPSLVRLFAVGGQTGANVVGLVSGADVPDQCSYPLPASVALTSDAAGERSNTWSIVAAV